MQKSRGILRFTRWKIKTALIITKTQDPVPTAEQFNKNKIELPEPYAQVISISATALHHSILYAFLFQDAYATDAEMMKTIQWIIQAEKPQVIFLQE